MSLYYQDDYVTLYHGDCLTEHREWIDADVLVTDPPYGMNLTTDFRSKEAGIRGQNIPVMGDQSPAVRDAALNLWGTTRPGLAFGTWRVARPSVLRNLLVWDKGDSPGVGNTNIPWGLSHEEVYVLGDWPAIKSGGRAREGGQPSRVSSVVRCAALNSQAVERPKHPTPKPVGLMERLIERCPPGIIADPFAGSGSTLIAAKNLGRRAVGVELEEKYCEIIANRCAQGALDFSQLA